MYGFKQLINKPTRTTSTSATIIDLFFTNSSENIVNSDVFITSLSDHNIDTARKINNAKFPTLTVKCRNYKNYDKRLLANEVSLIDWIPEYEATDANVALKYFNHKLKSLFDKHAPISEKSPKSRLCKWLTAELKIDMNNRDRLHQKVQKSRKLADIKDYKKRRNICNNKILKAKANYHREIIDQNSSNPRKLWNAIKIIFPTKTKKFCSSSYNNKDPVKKFSIFFSTIVQDLGAKSFPLMNCT